jgi:hypothetical protein
MYITLKSKEIDALKDKLTVVASYARSNDWNPEKKMRIDLAKLTEEQIGVVEKVLEKEPERNKNPLKDIKQWRKILENPDDRKAATLEQFPGILKTYLSKVPRYMVFSQTEDDDVLAYVVTDIGYQKAVRHQGWTSPAYAYMRLTYHEQGKNKVNTVKFSQEAVKGKSCAQIMNASGFVMATDESLAKYEEELLRYKATRGAVGKQYLGSGRATVISHEKRWWGGMSREENALSLDTDGRKSRLVVDLYEEKDDEDGHSRSGEKADVPVCDGSFWKNKVTSQGDEGRKSYYGRSSSEVDEVDGTEQLVLDIPTHPYVLLFHLEKHCQVWAHVSRLEEYVYDKTLRDKLVLPDTQRELIEILVQRDRAEIQDIVRGKAGGSIVLCSGKPGTGKTLTAEVFAEVMERPLYVVQSAQLGTKVEELEDELCHVLARSARWGAILLIDEADVFIHERGDDMVQNAVVGVFLRVLEYYQGVLFMTTNRDTVVDDAVISRCTAQVKFEIPDSKAQAKIWFILAGVSNVKIAEADVIAFAKKHSGLSGRDVKGILKLANMIAVSKKQKVTAELLEYVLQFKPTTLSTKK